jgi:DNA-binding NarL/FixJ family response regulator
MTTDPIRVVIADDAEILRALLVRALSRDPRLEVVGQAINGRQAVDLVDELAPDVLLLDLSMPVLDGIGVLRELSAKSTRRPSTAVVVLTGYGEADLGEQCRGLGVHAFVEKGVSLSVICDALVAAAGREL